MNGMFSVYLAEDNDAALITTDGGEAIGVFLQAVMESGSGHVRLEWSA